MNPSWSLLKEELRPVQEVCLKDKQVRGGMGMQCKPCRHPRAPTPKNQRQANVVSQRLTKKIEIQGDGSKIQEQACRYQEFKFREFKINKGILCKFGFSDICKDCAR